MTESKDILLGFSGGVDSSLAAALLLEAGHRVFALTLKMDPRNMEAEDAKAQRAAAVAAQLGIDHQIEDARSDFEQTVLRPAWDEYRRGRTPNPCARCNPAFKFARLAQIADARGFAHLATGHYARIEQSPEGPGLYRGADRKKDQSYFLFDLSRSILARTRLPLGDLNKGQVRRRAADLGLSNAKQAESQDVCIALAGENFPELLRELFAGRAQPGPVVDPSGHELGRHAGLHRYTIGQRRGLGLALGAPAWVCKIDADSARLVVSRDPADLLCPELEVADLRWSADFAPQAGTEVLVQIRSQHKATPAHLQEGDGGRFRLIFAEPQRAVAPGQAAVIYDLSDTQVLGGGWIV